MPKLTLSWGTIAEARADGFDDMLHLHWEEVENHHEDAPLAINWTAYRNLERAGVLRLLLLRRTGQLVGYSVWFVQPTLHHALSTWAVCDVLYVDPDTRRGRAGVQLIVEGERMLRELGVKAITYTVKPARQRGDLGYKRGRDSVGVLLSKLGYALDEETWAKHF